ncbi:hypothetical protein ACFOEZ_00565 [Tianweitania populi]|uniref:MFS transporter n=1 Tax=Tianweitania populi TaxID=1607949 RepID=A0A8J3DZ11_9HYPH|nr:hypothetical protein [Tianweitania populi]GHD21974.1 hypothetical protein GCM10016234_35880 [Tianweitania populi]
MENTSASHSVRWTLADFLSTYRFWALFAAALFVAVGGQSLTTFFPLMLSETGSSYQTIGLFYFGLNFGWVIGAFLAFVVGGRHPLWALISPLTLCTLTAIAFSAIFYLGGTLALLFPFGLLLGTVQAVFPITIAVTLNGGRPSRLDFAGALAVLSTTLLASNFAAFGSSLLYGRFQNGLPILLAFVAYLVLAVIVLMAAPNLSFVDQPRPRHVPLEPRRRSPWKVALLLLTPPVLLGAMILANYILEDRGYELFASPAFLIGYYLILALVVAAFIYFLYWMYRIHGELAGAEPSQRLLTPLGALLIALLAPLAVPILITTLGDILNDRARERGQARAVSISWLAIWTFLLPPVAFALIQNAANKSYALDAS